ncbi:MAG: hypothetical protein AAGI53_13610 [Planctomycetota bacterium]
MSPRFVISAMLITGSLGADALAQTFPAVRPRHIAVQGQLAPGFPNGERFELFDTPPRIARDGTVLFSSARVTGDPVVTGAGWAFIDRGGPLEPLLVPSDLGDGYPLPVMSAQPTGSPWSWMLAGGELMVLGGVSVETAPSQSSTASVLFTSSVDGLDAGLAIDVYTDMSLSPPDGGVLSGNIGRHVFGPGSSALFRAQVDGPERVVARVTGGVPAVLAVEGGPVPGLDGWVFDRFVDVHGVHFNRSYFSAIPDAGGVDATDADVALYVAEGESVTQVIRVDDPVPGIPGYLMGWWEVVHDGAGRLLMGANIRPDGTTREDPHTVAYFLVDGAAVTPLLELAGAAPHTDGAAFAPQSRFISTIPEFSPFINDRFAFVATVAPGSGFFGDSRDEAMYLYDNGTVRLVMREGDAAVDEDADVLYRFALPYPADFDFGIVGTTPMINARGDVAFETYLSDALGGRIKIGRLYLYDAGREQIRRVVGVGDELTIPFGSNPQVPVEVVGFEIFDETNGGAVALNDAQQIGVRIRYGTTPTDPLSQAIAVFDMAPCNAADLAIPYFVLDSDDVNAFIAAFLAQDSITDLVEPFGTLDLDDVDAFVTGYFAGCP